MMTAGCFHANKFHGGRISVLDDMGKPSHCPPTLQEEFEEEFEPPPRESVKEGACCKMDLAQKLINL